MKPGQYLDHKKCACKNKLVGRIIEECTNIINETMMNNDNYDNVHNYYYNVMLCYVIIIMLCTTYVFIGLFLIALVICFCVFAYFKWFKGKYTNNYKNEY